MKCCERLAEVTGGYVRVPTQTAEIGRILAKTSFCFLVCVRSERPMEESYPGSMTGLLLLPTHSPPHTPLSRLGRERGMERTA